MKSIIRIICLLLLTISGTIRCYSVNGANEYNLQTPNAADLGRFGMFPVSYFSGTANVTIPIYSTNQQGVPLDIFLQYDGSGVKPNRLPGWTGTNWTLMAGGVINRVKKGKSDETESEIQFNYFKHFYIPSQFQDSLKEIKKINEKLNNLQLEIDSLNPKIHAAKERSKEMSDLCLKQDLLRAEQKEQAKRRAEVISHIMWFRDKYDTEPDVYYFNFLGISGHFLLGNDGKWKVSCDRNISIRIDENNLSIPEFDKGTNNHVNSLSSIKGFTLIDDNGYQYIFGATDRLEHQTCEPVEYSINLQDIGNDRKQVCWNSNSWYLTAVLDRTGNVVYQFEYERGKFITQLVNSFWYEQREFYYYVEGIYFPRYMGNRTSVDSSKFPYLASISSPVYLKKIKTLSGETIEFFTEPWLKTDKTLYPSIYAKYENLFLKDYYLLPKEVNLNDQYRYTYLQDPSYSQWWFQTTDDTEQNPLAHTGLYRLKEIRISENDNAADISYSLTYDETADKSGKGPSRLFLTEVTESSIKNPSQEQKYGMKYKPWRFELPDDYLTSAVDRCGLYNGNDSSFVDIFNTNGSIHSKMKKFAEKYVPDSAKSLCGMLEKITFPTGGCTVFEYGLNKCESCLFNGKKVELDNHIFGGVRVERMTSYSDESCSKKVEERTYTYELGESSYDSLSFYCRALSAKTAVDRMDATITKINFNSVVPFCDDYCNTFGYSKITETIHNHKNKELKDEENICNVYYYSNLFTNYLIAEGDLPPVYAPVRKSKVQMYHENKFPIIDNPYCAQLSFSRGKLLKTEKYANGKLIYSQSNEYRSDKSMLNQFVYTSDCGRVGCLVGYEYNCPINYWYFTGCISKHFYPRFDIVKTTETYYDNEKEVTADLTTTYEKVDYGQLRYDRSITKTWNPAGHTSDAQTEDKVVYKYAFDFFANQNSSTNTNPIASSSQKPTPNPGVPNVEFPQWMKDQGLSYNVKSPDWVLTIGAEGHVYKLPNEIIIFPSQEHPGWRYVGLFQVICEYDWSREMRDSVVQVLLEEKAQWDLAQDIKNREEAKRIDSISKVREDNALRDVSSDFVAYETKTLQSFFIAKHFYPVINAETYHNNVKVGVAQTRYKDYAGLLMPSISAQSIGDSIVSYTKYLEYNDLGLPTKMQSSGKPVTYLFWDKTRLVALATSGDTANVPTYTPNANPLESVMYGDHNAFACPMTQTKVATYDSNNRVSSMTDELGLTNYYDYDGFGRLVSVRNKKKQRTASYSYHIQEDGYNFIKTNALMNEEGTDSLQSIQYYDGLGRPTLLASNASNPQKKFAYTLTEYDSFGRESKIWSPVFDATIPNGGVETDFASRSRDLYNDDYGYTKTVYDALGRVIKTTRPGKAWHTQNKNVSISYGFNAANDVKKYDIEAHNDVLYSSYYAKGDLKSTTTVDEDNQRTTVFTDSRDLTVLERRMCDGHAVETYYVYNDLGQLVWVLQPMYQENENLSKYAFHYEYNGKGQVQKKTIPGCQPIQFWYDKDDRLSKMQDGLLRAVGKYRIYSYDGLGRLKRQSISADGKTVEYDEIRNFYDNYDFLKEKEYADMVSANHMDTVSLCPFYPKNGHGHLTGVWQRASNGEAMLMSYNYDDYGRLTMTKEIGLDKHLAVQYHAYNFNGTVKTEHNDFYRYSADEEALNDNSLYGTMTNNYYASNNNLLQNSVIWLKHAGAKDRTCDEIQNLTYDDFGRVLKNDRIGNAGDISYEYDKLHGWLKKVKASNKFHQVLFREDSDKNARFNGSISAMSWDLGDYINRTYHYKYDELNRLTEAQYSGDCFPYEYDSEKHRLILNRDKVPDYSEYINYDSNCNIVSLDRKGTSNNKKGRDIDLLRMEYNGNQLTRVSDQSGETLNYDGASDFVDRVNAAVEYDYNENGAMTKDLNKGIKKIEYDLLGNPFDVTLSDDCHISYVYAADGRKLRTLHIRFLPMRRNNNSSSLIPGIEFSKTDYVGVYVFENNRPVMYKFKGGYYSFDNEGKMNGRHLYLQDYQGNNRLVVNADTDSVEQVNQYYPYGALIGDISTNPDVQKYKYSGKELDRLYGLDLNDFHARQQDPLIGGRFTSVDPLAEQTPQISPYAYCKGDPINCIDPDGKITIYINGFDYWPSHRGDVSYWDDSFINTFNAIDKPSNSNDIFLDGSVGSDIRLDGSMSLNPNYRRWFGEFDGEKLAPQIASSLLKNENGDYIEPIYIVTHSMGAAYGKGFVKMLVAYFESLGGKMPIITEFDFQPHQPEFQKAHPMVETWQISHIDDWVVDNALFKSSQGEIDGAIQIPQHPKDGTGHRNATNGHVLDWICNFFAF